MTSPFDITAGPLPNGTLVEASAGTGKTHAVAAAVTKALAMDNDLRIGEILVTTYTRNAAAELCERIRGRLIVTAALLRGDAVPHGYGPDELDRHLLAADPAGRAMMARRLERAAAEFDTAIIGTIHAICAGVLRLAGIEATEHGDEDLYECVLDEVVNDTIVTETLAGRNWSASHLRDLLRHHLADPFLENSVDSNAIPEAGRDLIEVLPDLLEGCVRRVRDRLRVSPSFDELLVRTREELTASDDDSTSTRDRKATLLETLRKRFKLAIVDEAQDTNRLQWEIFHAIFPPTGAGVLVSVGDPKQAIYGFRGADVTAYLEHAQDGVPDEDGKPPRRTLSVNRRSDGPLLAGLNKLMEGAEFGEGIPYRNVEPAPGRDRARVQGLAPVEMLDTDDMPLDEATARKVFELLTRPCFTPESPAASDQAQMRPFRPEEVCVLVRVNRIGDAVARRLLALGIPTVTGGTASVMESRMADDIRTLLESMERPSNVGRTRRAAATVFFGERLTDVATLPEERVLAIQSTIASLHGLLNREGLAAFTTAIQADAEMARRIGTGPGGDRRLVDFAHVTELLEGACGGRGCHAREVLGHIGTLAARDNKSELVSRRVESDAAAVTVMTVHTAKGLQFPCVVVVDKWTPAKAPTGVILYHEEGERRADVGKVIPGGDAAAESKEAAKLANNDELRRLVYVALTRPEHHLCIVRGKEWQDSVLGMVVRDADSASGASVAVRSAADLPEAARWNPSPRTKAIANAPVPAAVVQTYQRTSFTDIKNRSERRAPVVDDPAGRGDDENHLSTDISSPETDVEPSTTPMVSPLPDVSHLEIAPLPAGTAFGSMVHTIFERIETGTAVSEASLRERVDRVIGDVVKRPRFLAEHRESLADMIGDALLTPFGGPADSPYRGLRFADFSPADRLTELNFEMALAGFRGGVQARHVGALLQSLLSAHDPLASYADRLAALPAKVPLSGIANGSIDALLRMPGSPADAPRLIIADYKTNRLHDREQTSPMEAYAPARLASAMAEGHYPLQALLYGTAVWRMLRWRLGPRKPAGWDPGECIAGVVYAFLRGMKGADTPTDAEGRRYGVFSWQPPRVIWRQLSDLLAGDLEEVER
jgi:exodeoxyribonuclease V beta subunit